MQGDAQPVSPQAAPWAVTVIPFSPRAVQRAIDDEAEVNADHTAPSAADLHAEFSAISEESLGEPSSIAGRSRLVEDSHEAEADAEAVRVAEADAEAVRVAEAEAVTLLPIFVPIPSALGAGWYVAAPEPKKTLLGGYLDQRLKNMTRQ